MCSWEKLFFCFFSFERRRGFRVWFVCYWSLIPSQTVTHLLDMLSIVHTFEEEFVEHLTVLLQDLLL